MKYNINQKGVMSQMLGYVKKFHPELLSPLVTHKENIYTNYYSGVDGTLILQESHTNNVFAIETYVVSPSLVDMYYFFGENKFEEFFLSIYGIDLKIKSSSIFGDRKYDWSFGEEPFE